MLRRKRRNGSAKFTKMADLYIFNPPLDRAPKMIIKIGSGTILADKRLGEMSEPPMLQKRPLSEPETQPLPIPVDQI